MADDIIRKPAIKITQGRHTLFATSFTVADFMREGLYRVKHLDTEQSIGFQRVLDQSRAKSLAKDLSKADKQGETFLPTAILLATSATADELGYDDETRKISFSVSSSSSACPFLVVDGQHRIAGLREFANDHPARESFPVSVNIITGMNNAQQMLQFLIVNAKQRAVDKGLQQHIIKQFTEMQGFDKVYLPDWVERKVETKKDKLAIDIVNFLIQHSPWSGKITRSDHGRRVDGHTIGEQSLIQSIKAHILSENNSLSDEEPERRGKILVNYWHAVDLVFAVGGIDTVVYKSTGVNFFHRVSAAVVERCNNLQDYTVDNIQQIFLRARERMVTKAYMHPEWWESSKKGETGEDETDKSRASGMNDGGISRLASELSKTIRNLPIVAGGDIKI